MSTSPWHRDAAEIVGRRFGRAVLLPRDTPETAHRTRTSGTARAGGQDLLRRTRGRWVSRHPALLPVLVTAGLHLLFLSPVLGSDEGGFAMVARFWDAPGGYLYGPQWVDRPPGLIWVFSLADDLGAYGTRILATVAAVLIVLGVTVAARALRGRTAGRWAAWAAAAFASSTLLSAQELNGELVAATLVTWTIALAVVARRRDSGRLGDRLTGLSLAAVAGCLATGAVLMKQDFFDGLAFLGVWVLLPASRTGWSRRERARFAAAAGSGSLAVVGACWWWADAHGGLGRLLYACFGSRLDMARLISPWSQSVEADRLGALLLLAALSGIGILAVQLLLWHGVRIRRSGGVALALLAAGGVELAGVAGGGNYWPHYLIGLIPTVSVAAGMAVGRPGWRLTRVIVVASVLASLVSGALAVSQVRADPGAAFTSARWLDAAARPGDSLTVTYSHANIIDESGMRPAYPYSWSLPVRIRDPHLTLLRQTLAGPAAPTWVLQWDAPDTWGLDPHQRLDPVLRAHYRQATVLCGHPVWLHRGYRRHLPPLPTSASCRTVIP